MLIISQVNKEFSVMPKVKVDVASKVKIASDEAFLAAVKSGDIQKLDKLNYTNKQLRKYTLNGDSVLHIALNMQAFPMARYLIDVGADVNAKSQPFGSTPLHRAVCLKEAAIVKLLLAKGAKIDSIDNNGQTALHHCVNNFDSDIFKLLIAENADLNISNKFNMTPLALLHTISNDKEFPPNKYLVERGARLRGHRPKNQEARSYQTLNFFKIPSKSFDLNSNKNNLTSVLANKQASTESSDESANSLKQNKRLSYGLFDTVIPSNNITAYSTSQQSALNSEEIQEDIKRNASSSWRCVIL